MMKEEHEADVPAMPRVEGHVLLLLPASYEGARALRPQRAPIPVNEWVAVMRRGQYRASWMPAGAIEEGSYQGGSVVEVDVRGDRAYVAVPPEALDTLAEVMSVQEHQMLREDVAALTNPKARGLMVTRLDRTAWEERREVVPQGGPLPTEVWVSVIRENGMHVQPPSGVMLPLESAWPAGQVVTVTAGQGKRRSYFAVPRTALRLALDLSVETGAMPASSD
jgi:hypothetical protein